MMQKTMMYLLLASLVALSQAAPLSSLSKKSTDGILTLPIRRNINSAQLQQRDLPVTLTNTYYQYLVDLEIGSPAQSITLSIDTGSSEVWVYGQGSCSQCDGGTFDPTQSTTAEVVTDYGNFSASYFDGSSTTGYYISEDLSISGVDVTNVIIGVAQTATDHYYGIMGLGFDGLESAYPEHAGFLDDLYQEGIIGSNSYSIYLDSDQSSTGSIIFGGVDSSKYSGDLVPLPMIPYVDSVPRLNVNLSYISVTDASGSTTQLTPDGYSRPVTLDTGSTITDLPSDAFNSILSLFDTTLNSNGDYDTGCTAPSGSLTFGFGEGPAVAITVPFSELAVPSPGSSSDASSCLFGLQAQSATQSVMTFGDTFLRSAYVYYDFDNLEISLAQSAWA